jgi:hypothetical protein
MNDNCLSGMACPSCESKGPFLITGTADALVFDDGVDEYRGFGWEADSTCSCTSCGFVGEAKGFSNG